MCPSTIFPGGIRAANTLNAPVENHILRETDASKLHAASTPENIVKEQTGHIKFMSGSGDFIQSNVLLQLLNPNCHRTVIIMCGRTVPHYMHRMIRLLS